MTSADRSGEGWSFADGAQCRVLTAGHVVAGAVAPLLVDAGGNEGQGRMVAVPTRDLMVGGAPMDAAELAVAGSLRAHCADDLGYRDLGPTLDRISRSGGSLYFEKVGPHGSEEVVALTLVAVNRDGMRLTVRLADRKADPVVESDSGSPVLLRSGNQMDSGLPIGLITDDLGDGEISVLRMDALRRWLQSAGGGEGVTPTAAYEIAGWSGVTPDPACGPLNLVTPAAACGWRALPLPRQNAVTVDLTLAAGDRPVSEVEVALEPGSVASGVGVDAMPGDRSDPDAAWVPLTYCEAPASSVALTCNFAPRIGRAYRVRIAGLRGGVRAVAFK